MLALVLLTWLPLLLLSIVEGHAWGRSVELPFLRDVETNVRFLLAAPLLILAEVACTTACCRDPGSSSTTA